MEKMKEALGKKIKDETATYAILIAICITVITTLGVYTLIQHNQSISTSTLGVEDNKSETEEETEESIENLTSVENINSIEELQKLNEKEVEEAKKKEKEKNKDDKKDEKDKIDLTPKYYIKVNYKAQVVTIYTKDKNGKYTKPVKTMVCSTGTYTPTSGTYKTPHKFRWLRMVGGVYSQYCTQIVGDILFHSVPYLERGNHASLEYWAYDKLGTRASLGCVRLTCKDAKWIYDNCTLGTQVEFYASSNPGPLGKPSARKISSAPDSVRGWDPTDPAKGNPWPAYLKEQANNKNDKDKTENNNKKPTPKPDPKPTPTPDPEPDPGLNPDPIPNPDSNQNEIVNNDETMNKNDIINEVEKINNLT